MKLDAADARKMRIVYMLSGRDKLIQQEVRKVYTENLLGEELAEQLHKEVDDTYTVEQWKGLLRDSIVLHNRSIVELSDKNQEDNLMAATLKANQDDFYSYIVTFAPDLAKKALQFSPAGPLPITAIFFPFNSSVLTISLLYSFFIA